uniref:Uncharacterized protein n=1 Tax=Anguilla anguilla TaxID=7936 RepID=A0A0E9UXN4_ANGAN
MILAGRLWELSPARLEW